MVDAALNLAGWIRGRYPYAILDPLTHLKLQKLAFYCYGAALAFERDGSIGRVDFEPWDHGPVNPKVFRELRDYKGNPLPPVSGPGVSYDPPTEALLSDVLRVYGVLDAWKLRQQSHLEAPWIDAYRREAQVIPLEEIREHFVRKFRSGRVQTPEYLFDLGSFGLDGIPVRSAHASLQELARFVGRTVGASG